VYGPRQPPGSQYAGVIPLFIDALRNGGEPTVHGDGEQSRDFTFIDTVTEVLARSVQDGTTTSLPVNLAFGTRTTVNELIKLLSAVLGKRLDVEHRPTRAGDVRHSQARLDRIHATLGYEPTVDFEEGLRRTLSEG